MKKIKLFAFAVMTVLSVASVTYFNSCKKDPCKDVVCNNGGTCVDGTCSCTTGYEGTNCETDSRDKFVGQWKANETGSVGGAFTYTATVAKGSNSNLTITNFTAAGASCVFSGSADQSKMMISAQTVCGYSISNVSASLSGSTITISYTANDGTTSETVTGTWTKL